MSSFSGSSFSQHPCPDLSPGLYQKMFDVKLSTKFHAGALMRWLDFCRVFLNFLLKHVLKFVFNMK